MTFKDQLLRLRENWLLLVIVLAIVLFPRIGSIGAMSLSSYGGGSYSAGVYGESYKGDVDSGIYNNRNFAPDELDRKVVKTVYLASETKRGNFQEDEDRVREIVASSGSFILSENVNRYGEKARAYYQGYYSLKVPATMFDIVVGELKKIGEVKSFSENSQDITGSYTDLTIELDAEKQRMERYESMYDEAVDVEDKITLNDRIFDQERKIKYMEETIAHMDETIDYSTISLTLTEKQSEYADIMLVKLSELVRSLVVSINSMIQLIFVLLPWIAGLAAIVFLSRLKRRRGR